MPKPLKRLLLILAALLYLFGFVPMVLVVFPAAYVLAGSAEHVEDWYMGLPDNALDWADR